jgi:recombination protein RecA
MASRKDLLERMAAKVDKALGSGSTMLMRNGVMPRAEVREVIPTGLKALDRYVLGVGGLPVGRMVEIFGPEMIGKSSLLYQIIGNVQKEKTGWAALADPENAFNEDRVRTFGTDPSKLLVLENDTLESILPAFANCMQTVDPTEEGPGLIGWDSLAGTQTERQKKGALDMEVKEKMAEKAAILANKLPGIVSLLAKSRTCLVALNQVRQKLGLVFGDSTTTAGGNAWKHLLSVRLQLFPGKSVKVGKERVGRMVYISTQKNRFAAPFRRIEARFLFETGWDERYTTVSFAKQQKLVSSLDVDDDSYIEALTALGWYDPKAPLPPMYKPEGRIDEDDEVDFSDESSIDSL